MEYTTGSTVFDGWEIKKELGEGSYGKVFEIQKELALGIVTKSALKVMRIPRSAADVKSALSEGMDEKSVTTFFKGYVEKMMQEVAIMSSLKGHANIVSCENYNLLPHESGIGWDILIQMELLTGLTDYQNQYPMGEAEVVRMAEDLCKALDFCHMKRGIIHRDIKPSNIFVSEAGVFKLGDFGVARTMQGSISMMSQQGTDSYMAPEVYLNKKYGENVDLCSLGLVLYQYMNGKRLPFYPPASEPIGFGDREKALESRMKGEKLPPPAYASEEFAQIILKACAYDPKERYRSAADMLEDLERLKATRQRNGEEPEEMKVDVDYSEEDGSRGPFDDLLPEDFMDSGVKEKDGGDEESTRGLFDDLPEETDEKDDGEEGGTRGPFDDLPPKEDKNDADEGGTRGPFDNLPPQDEPKEEADPEEDSVSEEALLLEEWKTNMDSFRNYTAKIWKSYFALDIPPQELSNAMHYIAGDRVRMQDVLAIMDCSFNNKITCGEGMLVTRDNIYIGFTLERPFVKRETSCVIPYRKLAKLAESKVRSLRGKSSKVEWTTVDGKKGEFNSIYAAAYIDWEALIAFIQRINKK